ncbi:MAG: hypothetical protein RMI85_05685 [Candidatus Korarchaeum sp.]|nr:hypothetical protein [Candidatus Korarchaeum sp.]
MSESLKVDCLVIGTELSSLDKLDHWREIMKELKRIYSGKLSYSANFDSEATSFWDLLDSVEIDAYSPMLNSSSWMTLHESRVFPLILLYGKPVVFTEIGYRSVKEARLEPWNWKAKMERDEEEQSLLWRAFLDQEAGRIRGLFYWVETPWGDDGTDYSVLGKGVERTIGERLRADLMVFEVRSGVDVEIVRRVFSGAVIS